MSEWRIDTDGRTRAVDEATLREELRDGRLSGAERVRAPDGTAWMPLHAHAIFAEEVPTRRSAARPADGRIARGWMVHLATFFVVVLWAGKGKIPSWSIFWAIGLFAHTLRGLPALARSLQSKGAASPTRLPSGDSPQEAAAPVRQVEFPSAQPLSVHSPSAFLTEVDAAVRAVEGVWRRGAQGFERGGRRPRAGAPGRRRSPSHSLVTRTPAPVLHSSIRSHPCFNSPTSSCPSSSSSTPPCTPTCWSTWS